MKISLIIILLAVNITANAGVRSEIKRQAIKMEFDPALALAVAKVESNYDVKAIGALGEIGLFQLRPEFHGPAIYDYKNNIIIAIEYLKELKKICPFKDKKSFVICYNKGPNRKFLRDEVIRNSYYKKVMKEYEKIRTQELSNKLATTR